MPHRYFIKDISGGHAVLSGADAHHLAHVMRARLGETVILCDGNAVEYTGVITSIGPETVEFSVEEGYPTAAEPNIDVTLFVGYPKQDKLEEIIQHGTELGISHFVPFFSRYCVAAPKKEEQKNVRYARIALEAAKQAGRGIIPEVAMPLENFGAVCRAFSPYDAVLLFYECGGVSLNEALRQAQEQKKEAASPEDGEAGAQQKAPRLKLALVTGAEGGFAVEEAEAAAKAGAVTVGLGPRILRCETAPLAAAAAVMALTGNLE
jgi:16S rRNA (uracil1498-N3)-methyltransferase